jgi:hypothetical protein
MKNYMEKLHNGEKGVVGYALAWWLGVPASILFVIFLLRGCN